MANVMPLGALGRGLLAGVVGTAAMTAWQELASKLQRSNGNQGGDGERQANSEESPWENAPAPARDPAPELSEAARQEL